MEYVEFSIREMEALTVITWSMIRWRSYDAQIVGKNGSRRLHFPRCLEIYASPTVTLNIMNRRRMIKY